MSPLEAYILGAITKKVLWAIDKALGGIVADYTRKWFGKYVNLGSKYDSIERLFHEGEEKRAQMDIDLREVSALAKELWLEREQLQGQNIRLTIEMGKLLEENQSIKRRLASGDLGKKPPLLGGDASAPPA